jgi:hypothetical protein
MVDQEETKKEVSEMTVKCLNWKESEGLNGTVAFCSVAAYGGKLTAGEAKSCGCTSLKREKCMKAMMAVNGFGLVPEVYEEVAVTGNYLAKEAAFGIAL